MMNNNTPGTAIDYIPLKGTNNFRDAGGCRTADGRLMRLRQVFRADALNNLTPADLGAIARLGIRQVVDLRSLPEQEAAPDRLPSNAARHSQPINLAWQNPLDVKEKLFGHVAQGEFEADLVRSYSEVPAAHTTEFAHIFRLMLQPGGLPILIHCTGGKDRTGMTIALIQSALGVSRETIFQDYLYTPFKREFAIWRLMILIWFASRLRTPPPLVRPLLTACRVYLQSFFDSIESQYGSIDIYLRQGLGLQPSELVLLQEKLLEPA